jgi:hypothetical protein
VILRALRSWATRSPSPAKKVRSSSLMVMTGNSIVQGCILDCRCVVERWLKRLAPDAPACADAVEARSRQLKARTKR